MTTYNTGNPVGSSDPKDLFDNAENLDHWLNDRTVDTWMDRLGVERWTWFGMEQAFEQSQDTRALLFASEQDDRESRFQSQLDGMGYVPIGDYDDGPLNITERTETFTKDGDWWRASAALELPYTTIENWAADEENFVNIGEATLRSELAATGGVELVGDAVDKRENLADLPDKAAARASLEIARANQAQSEAGDSDTLFATPLGVSQRINFLRPSQAVAVAGTSNDHIMTPLRTKQAISSALAGQTGAHFAFRTDTRTSNETAVPCTYASSGFNAMIITHDGTAPPAQLGHMVVIRNVSASSGTPPQTGIYYVGEVDEGANTITVGTSGISGSGTLEMVFLDLTGSSNDFGVDSVVRVSAGIIVVNPTVVLISGLNRYNHGHVSGSARSTSAVLCLNSTINVSTLTPATALGGQYNRFISIQSGAGSNTDAADVTVVGFRA